MDEKVRFHNFIKPVIMSKGYLIILWCFYFILKGYNYLSVQLISATKHFKSPLIDKHAGSEKKNKVFISDKNKAK